MPEISLFRLYLLRSAYLLVAGGIALSFWPLLIDHRPEWPLMNGVVCSLLAAISILAILGIRHPLRMLPVLLVELGWKAIWLLAVALPLWRADALDAATMETVWNCLLGAILIPVIPWRYAVDRFIRSPGDRWTREPATRSGAQPQA